MLMMRPLAAAIGAVVGLALTAAPAFAGSFYPTQDCVAAKLKAASKKCQTDLKAWAKWDSTQDNNARDMAIAAATSKMSSAFTKADTKAAGKNVDCSQTSLTGSEMGTAIDSAVSGIVTAINTGLSLPTDGTCGGKLLKTAGGACQGLVKDAGQFFKTFGVDPTGTIRDQKDGQVTTKFTSKYNATVTGGCPATTSAAAALTQIETARDDVVSNTTTSPDLSTAWTMVTPSPNFTYGGETLSAVCSHGTPYSFFYKRGSGADVNKLLVYYQGGGACWDSITCSAPVYDPDVTAGDNPANTTTGFGDLTNGANPFRNWSAVFIAYCSADIHWGHNGANYDTVTHHGWDNARLVEKFAREHFVNPTEVFVTGSSAGAYGAILHGIYLHEDYLASMFNVVGDAGSGVVTQIFLSQNFQNAWQVQNHMPTYTGLSNDLSTLTIADLYIAGANYYGVAGTHHFAPRASRFGQYSTAYDGGGGSQTFFYNVMVNGILDNGSFWHSSCEWNREALQHAADAESGATNGNYESYFGPGSRHTIWGSNRVYTEVHGPVQPFVDWLDDMRTSPTWSSVACTDCSLLGSCNGGSNDTFSCQHDSECPGGVCNLVDAKPPFTCSIKTCNGGSNAGAACTTASECPSGTCAAASCQRNADCPFGGMCQVEASFGVCKHTIPIKCAGGPNSGTVCTTDSECPSSTCSNTNANKVCTTDADCDGTAGSCVTEQPFQLDGVVSCP